ncbi:hypothetical protein L1049_003489 [Liquidambar formosana]|uniref:Uncharacterized protein n=1 Tax=Liquidambar formosana TaxID=63359 RepID=A0AAP0R286_LIQFO
MDEYKRMIRMFCILMQVVPAEDGDGERLWDFVASCDSVELVKEVEEGEEAAAVVVVAVEAGVAVVVMEGVLVVEREKVKGIKESREEEVMAEEEDVVVVVEEEEVEVEVEVEETEKVMDGEVVVVVAVAVAVVGVGEAEEEVVEAVEEVEAEEEEVKVGDGVGEEAAAAEVVVGAGDVTANQVGTHNAWAGAASSLVDVERVHEIGLSHFHYALALCILYLCLVLATTLLIHLCTTTSSKYSLHHLSLPCDSFDCDGFS